MIDGVLDHLTLTKVYDNESMITSTCQLKTPPIISRPTHHHLPMLVRFLLMQSSRDVGVDGGFRKGAYCA